MTGVTEKSYPKAPSGGTLKYPGHTESPLGPPRHPGVRLTTARTEPPPDQHPNQHSNQHSNQRPNCPPTRTPVRYQAGFSPLNTQLTASAVRSLR